MAGNNSLASLESQFATIRNEQRPRTNTAERVGNALLSIIPVLEDLYGRIGNAGGGGFNQQEADARYLTIPFFQRLFTIHGAQNATVLPNDMSSPLTSIEARYGLWTEEYLTACGQGGPNSGNSSVSLNEPLAGINAAGLGAPSLSNVSLLWNGTQWTYGRMTGLDETALQSYLDNHSYATQSWVRNQNYLTSSMLSDYATQQWVRNQGYLTSISASDVPNIPASKIASGTLDFARLPSMYWANIRVASSSNETTTPIFSTVAANQIQKVFVIEMNSTGLSSGNGGYIDFHFGTNGANVDYTSRIIEDASKRLNINNALYLIKDGATASALPTTMSEFGASTLFHSELSGNVAITNSLYLRGSIHQGNNTILASLDTGGTLRNLLTFNSQNMLAIGYGTRLAGYRTDIQGGNITFGVGTSRVEAMEITNSGRVYVKQASQGLRIGDGLITWDSANNALKIWRADGSAANLYTTGGNAALGIGPALTELTAMTINYLKSMQLTFSGEGHITTDGDELHIGTGDAQAWVYLDNVCSEGGTNFWNIASTGYATFKRVTAERVYLDSTRFLWVDGTSLKYYNGSTNITIA